MPVNPWFRDVTDVGDNIHDEKNLYEDLIVESIQMYGQNCYYLCRESYDDGDLILGEYGKSFFSKAYLIECYVSDTDKFEGKGDFFTKFGLEIRDVANFILSRRSFRQTVPTTVRERPREGDLLYVPVMHRMFEVKFIEEEKFHFSLGKMLPYVFEMRCEMFRASHEPIQTGIEAVDAVGIENSYAIKINLSSGAGKYNLQEVVFQSANNNINGATAKGTVRTWDAANNSLLLYTIVGDFQPGSILLGNDSGATYMIQSVDGVTDFSYYDRFDNIDLETEGGEVINQSEINPFGTA